MSFIADCFRKDYGLPDLIHALTKSCLQFAAALFLPAHRRGQHPVAYGFLPRAGCGSEESLLVSMPATLDVVIVNYNSGRHLQACLESLVAVGPVVSLQRIVIVDNASSDGSAQRPRSFPHQLILMHNSSNRGFAAACNQGAHRSAADFILFLNPDTTLLPGCLDHALSVLCRPDSKEVGICGVQLLDTRGEPARTCMRFPSPGRFLARLMGLTRLAPERFPAYGMADWKHDETREVDAVLGAVFLVRRGVYEALGGFDERYFLYFEEVDFCKRARFEGWRTLYYSGAQAFHQGGPSWERADAVRLYHSARSRIIYSFVHFTWWSAAMIMVAVLVIEPIWRVLSALARRSWTDFRAGIGAYARLWATIPWVLADLGHFSARR